LPRSELLLTRPTVSRSLSPLRHVFALAAVFAAFVGCASEEGAPATDEDDQASKDDEVRACTRPSLFLAALPARACAAVASKSGRWQGRAALSRRASGRLALRVQLPLDERERRPS
jgi:hypothetical protein